MIFIASFVALFAVLWLLFLVIGPAMELLLKRAAHWTAAFRYHDYVPVLIVLVAGIGIALVAGDAFLDLAEGVREESPRLRVFDEEIHSWSRTTHSGGATLFFTALTILGTPVGLGILVLIGAGAATLRGHPLWGGYLILSCGLGGLLNLQLKSYFARARPEVAEALREAHGYSFPSGHAMGSTIVFGSLAYLAYRVLPTWKARGAALSLACTLTIAIAASRVYLGVHWISDIGAGVVAGLIWVVAATVAYETFRRVRHVRARRRHREGASV